MKRETISLSVTNEADLKAELIKISKAHPTAAITALVTFGQARAYIYPSLSRIGVDQPDTRQMLACFNGHLAYVNGKLVKPTSGWIARQNRHDSRTHQD